MITYCILCFTAHVGGELYNQYVCPLTLRNASIAALPWLWRISQEFCWTHPIQTVDSFASLNWCSWHLAFCNGRKDNTWRISIDNNIYLNFQHSLCMSLWVLWFNLAANNEALDSHSLTPPLSVQQDGEENWQKVKLIGWDKDCLIRQQRK